MGSTAASPAASPAAAPAAGDAPAPSSREARKAQAEERQRLTARLRPMRQELAQVDQRLARAGEERDRLTEAMVAPGLAAAERAEQGKRLKALGEEIEALEQRWLELTEAIEAGAAATS